MEPNKEKETKDKEIRTEWMSAYAMKYGKYQRLSRQLACPKRATFTYAKPTEKQFRFSLYVSHCI